MRTDCRELLAVGIFGRASLGHRIETLLKRGRDFSPKPSLARVVVSAGILLLLATACSFAPRWIAFAQQSERPKFEVATVKLNTSGSPRQLFGSKSPGTFNAENFPVRWLIAAAYHVKTFQVTGGPGWIDSTRYDITGKPRVDRVNGPAVTQSIQSTQIEMALMVQSLLEERFQLTMHRETKELPVYALNVARGGLKLREAPCTAYDPNNLPPRPPSGAKPPDYCGNFGIRGGPVSVLDAFGMTMIKFAENLPDLGLERVVIDKTGVTGKFNIHLEFARNETTTPDDPGRPEPETGPSLFTAMQEQLGLKLESAKGPVEVLVIDHVEKPGAN